MAPGLPIVLQARRLITIDRFPWQAGIQNRNVMAKVTRNTIKVSLQLFYDIGDQQWNGCVVVPFTFDCQVRVACNSIVILIRKVLIM